MGAAIRRRWAALRERLRSGSFFSRVALVVGATAFSQALIVLATPVLTRLYDPGDYGVFAVYMSLLAVVATVASMGYEVAVPLPQEDTAAANVMAVTLLLVTVLSAVAGVASWLLRAQIAAWTKCPALAGCLWLLPLGVFCYRTGYVLGYWALRKQKFRPIAGNKIGQAVSSVLVQLGMGLLRLKPLGLLAGNTLGYGVGTGVLALLPLREDREALRGISWRAMGREAWRYRRFPLFSVAALLNVCGTQLPPVLIASSFGAAAAGGFMLALRVLAWPMQLMGVAISQVYDSEVARLVREDPAGLYPLITRTARRLVLLGLPILGLGALSPSAFPFIFGHRWREAGIYGLVMAPLAFAQFVVSPVNSVANMLERQHLQLYADGSRTAIIVGVFVWGAQAHWTLLRTTIAYCGLTTLLLGASFVMYLSVARSAGRKTGVEGGAETAGGSEGDPSA